MNLDFEFINQDLNWDVKFDPGFESRFIPGCKKPYRAQVQRGCLWDLD